MVIGLFRVSPLRATRHLLRTPSFSSSQPILGCVLLTVINEIVLRGMGFEQARPLFYGAIMILSILFLPNGLESIVQKLIPRKSAAKSDRKAEA